MIPWAGECQKIAGILYIVRETELGRVLTSRDVAERFGVSLRTAERWLPAASRYAPIVADEIALIGGRGGQRLVYRKMDSLTPTQRIKVVEIIR